jgi:hypothetical protein
MIWGNGRVSMEIYGNASGGVEAVAHLVFVCCVLCVVCCVLCVVCCVCVCACAWRVKVFSNCRGLVLYPVDFFVRSH